VNSVAAGHLGAGLSIIDRGLHRKLEGGIPRSRTVSGHDLIIPRFPSGPIVIGMRLDLDIEKR
jgi:hypothetical protein